MSAARMADRPGGHGAPRPVSGVTLLEMLIVMGLIALLAGISFPSISAGLETLRLKSAGDSLSSFLKGVLNRADRAGQAMELTIAPRENAITVQALAPGFDRKLELPSGVKIVSVLPPPVEETGEPRRFVIYPGGTVPRLGVELANSRGARLIVRVDPILGIPLVEKVPAR